MLNRLVRIDNADLTYAAYRYDAQGRRIEKDVNGALTRYVYDGDAIVLEYDGADVLQARYSHGEEIDQPLAMTRGGQSFFYHTDHLGSVRLLTDAAGAVANRYDYDAFGNIEDATSYETVASPFGFTARERDAESGLMFYRARYYDPRIGRFISQDPKGCTAGDLNLYRYAFNDPLNLTDPYGKQASSGVAKNPLLCSVCKILNGTGCLVTSTADALRAAVGISQSPLSPVADMEGLPGGGAGDYVALAGTLLLFASPVIGYRYGALAGGAAAAGGAILIIAGVGERAKTCVERLVEKCPSCEGA